MNRVNFNVRWYNGDGSHELRSIKGELVYLRGFAEYRFGAHSYEHPDGNTYWNVTEITTGMRIATGSNLRMAKAEAARILTRCHDRLDSEIAAAIANYGMANCWLPMTPAALRELRQVTP